MDHTLEGPSSAASGAVSAFGESAQGGVDPTLSTVVIGLFTLVSTLLALYLFARGRTRDDHRGDE